MPQPVPYVYTDPVYPASIQTIQISPILARARSIHRINNGKVSLIPDLSLASVVATTPPVIPLLFQNDEGQAALASFSQYSTDCPLRLVQQTVANAQQYVYFLRTVIPGWNNKFAIEKIQYLIGTLSEELFVDDMNWSQTIDPGTCEPVLRFTTDWPGGGTGGPLNGLFGIWYMAPHMWDLSNNLTTAYEYHSEAISQLIAAYVLEQAATVAAGFGDKQIFENKDLQGLADRLQGRATKCREEYMRIVNKDADGFGPHFAKWVLPTVTGWTPFHPTNTR